MNQTKKPDLIPIYFIEAIGLNDIIITMMSSTHKTLIKTHCLT